MVALAQQCEICHANPAPERHFVTVPLQHGFSRIFDEDYEEIKAEIRSRAKGIVAEVLAEAKARNLKRTPNR
jgi:hypothetical protein